MENSSSLGLMPAAAQTHVEVAQLLMASESIDDESTELYALANEIDLKTGVIKQFKVLF